MSIISDAIKKARKEFEIENKNVSASIAKEESLFTQEAKPSEKKWTLVVVLSLIVIASLLGAISLYTYMSRLNSTYAPPTVSTQSEIPATFNKGQPKINIFDIKEDMIELNGIVYGPQDKWAIINNKIVREGDIFPGGRLTFIAEDCVRIEKTSGEEITLDLR